MNNNAKKYLASFFLSLIIFAATFSFLSAFSDGNTGRTKKNSSAGCGSCHIFNPAITGSITGYDTVYINNIYQNFYLNIIPNSATGSLGCDIAVARGTLGVVSGSGLKLSNGELTHSSPLTNTNPKNIQFVYTAPATQGTDTIFANVCRFYQGSWNWIPNKILIVKNPSSGIINNETPLKFYLSQNYPNPFNPVTKINYGITKSSIVKIVVYDVLGNEVAILVNEYQKPGNYFVDFNASHLSSGIYPYKIQTENIVETKKMILIR